SPDGSTLTRAQSRAARRWRRLRARSGRRCSPSPPARARTANAWAIVTSPSSRTASRCRRSPITKRRCDAMKEFMDKDFLLSTATARKLYKAARDMPIFDYHCHLSPREIYENIQFRNIGHLMLGGDHYKWRAMRANGVPEALCCAAGDDWEKFLAF